MLHTICSSDLLVFRRRSLHWRRVVTPSVTVGSVLREKPCSLVAQPVAFATAAPCGGVSSFGYSGTITHVVLTEATGSTAPPAVMRAPMRAPALHEVFDIAQRITSAPFDADVPLIDAGFDSLGTVEMRDVLHVTYGVALPDTLVFDFPTTRKITENLEQLCNGLDGDWSAARLLQQQTRSVDAPALVGRSALVPRGAACVRAARRIFECGFDLLVEVPRGRWNAVVGLSELPASRVRHGGFVEGTTLFDGRRFSIITLEGAAMDPQQRLVLEYGYTALHASGLK